MGVVRSVLLPVGASVSWPAIADRLAGHAYPVPLRMIDGLPAFPNEEPPADWRELRVATPGGMVTLRRTGAGIGVIIWSTADTALEIAANALLWAVAEVSGGQVETDAGSMTAAEFAKSVDLSWPI